jgi:Txe/YoeB family toxin of Txe-Axe toxin-antitoxin module
MAWIVNDNAQRARFNAGRHVQVPVAAMRKYYEWKHLITSEDLAPNVAADRVGDLHYEQLQGRHRGTYTIRLSQEHRVVFTIVGQQVIVSQIGGHFP